MQSHVCLGMAGRAGGCVHTQKVEGGVLLQPGRLWCPFPTYTRCLTAASRSIKRWRCAGSCGSMSSKIPPLQNTPSILAITPTLRCPYTATTSPFATPWATKVRARRSARAAKVRYVQVWEPWLTAMCSGVCCAHWANRRVTTSCGGSGNTLHGSESNCLAAEVTEGVRTNAVFWMFHNLG